MAGTMPMDASGIRPTHIGVHAQFRLASRAVCIRAADPTDRWTVIKTTGDCTAVGIDSAAADAV